MLCLSLIVGATYALLINKSETNISINSGKVEVIATVTDLALYSHKDINIDDPAIAEKIDVVGNTFPNMGTATYENGTLTLDRITPGDGVTFNISITNNSNVAIKYRTVISDATGNGLIKGLAVTIDGNTYNGTAVDSEWVYVGVGATIESIPVSIELPTTADDEYENLTANLVIAVQAVQGNTDTGSEVKEATVSTATQLQEILTNFTDAGSGDNVINISEDITLAEGETWTPVTIDGYNGAGVITINGNGHTISGLNDTLLAGGFAGNSGIIINDLTIADANITSSNAQGYGAFINCIDSMPKIELNNCHLVDSTITDTLGARVGGLIGWSAGYNVENNGPVDTYITINGCSVTGCTITANGSVGAIIGHAGNNPATYHTITNCTVKNNVLTSTDDGGWRVGVVVGTANVGEVTISETVSEGNTLSQTGKTAPEGQSDLYGRFVPGTTGKLTIDKIEIN